MFVRCTTCCLKDQVFPADVTETFSLRIPMERASLWYLLRVILLSVKTKMRGSRCKEASFAMYQKAKQLEHAQNSLQVRPEQLFYLVILHVFASFRFR